MVVVVDVVVVSGIVVVVVVSGIVVVVVSATVVVVVVSGIVVVVVSQVGVVVVVEPSGFVVVVTSGFVVVVDSHGTVVDVVVVVSQPGGVVVVEPPGFVVVVAPSGLDVVVSPHGGPKSKSTLTVASASATPRVRQLAGPAMVVWITPDTSKVTVPVPENTASTAGLVMTSTCSPLSARLNPVGTFGASVLLALAAARTCRMTAAGPTSSSEAVNDSVDLLAPTRGSPPSPAPIPPVWR